MSLKTLCATLGTSLFEFIFPPLCFSCGMAMRRAEGRICPGCVARMTNDRPSGEVYGATRRRLIENWGIADLIVPFSFEADGPVQNLVHQMKYDGMQALGEELGSHLGRRLREFAVGEALLIPVPLHPARKRERGYNQAECLCRGAARVTGWPIHTDLLFRRRYTATQTKLNLDERRANVKDAFALRRSAGTVRGKDVFIVDDVITTGATVGECGRVLRSAGALRVVACAAALAS